MTEFLVSGAILLALLVAAFIAGVWFRGLSLDYEQQQLEQARQLLAVQRQGVEAQQRAFDLATAAAAEIKRPAASSTKPTNEPSSSTKPTNELGTVVRARVISERRL